MPTYTTGSAEIVGAYAAGSRQGEGRLTISGGAYTFSTFFAAREGGIGTVRLEQGATVNLRDLSGEPTTDFPGNLDVGVSFDNNQSSTGTLEIVEGSQAVVTTSTNVDENGFVTAGYNAVRIGQGLGTVGLVVVSGAGSRLETQGGVPRITVGENGGDGTLRVEDGGFVGANEWDVGRGNAVGRVIIDGPGSEIVNSSNYGAYVSAYSGYVGFPQFGRGSGTGYLTIQNGGRWLGTNVDGETDAPFLSFGREAGATGIGLVTGYGSSLELVQVGDASENYSFGVQLDVGRGGRGELTVADRATVQVLGDGAEISVGEGRNDEGEASRLEILSGATVTVDSQGFGGTPSTGAPFYRGAEFLVGRNVNTEGSVLVDGSGSQLRVGSDTNVAGDYVTGQIRVGVLGTGAMTVSNGAVVTGVEIQMAAAAAYIDGDGNRQTVFGGYVENPDYVSNGRLDILSGGTVTVETTLSTPYRGVRAGESSGTVGTITVDGEGSRLTSTGGAGMVEIANFGEGSLTVQNGGLVEGHFVDIGRNRGSDGLLLVDGAGSRLLVSDAFGTFADADGNRPDNSGGFLRAGRNDGSMGRIEITNGGVIDVENDPDGISDIPAVVLARTAGSSGTLTVSGAGSALNITLTGASDDGFEPGQTNGAALTIGRGGDGAATVSAGGAIAISGADSVLFVGGGNPGDDVGEIGAGTLTIEGGGRVSVEGENATVSIANSPSNTGTVTVSGMGSELVASALLLVGEGYDLETDSATGAGGRAVLEIDDGGSVAAESLIVGSEGRLDADGAVMADVTVTGALAVGGRGVGSLAVDGDLVLGPAARLELDVGPAGADQITVSGDLTIDLAAVEIGVDTGALEDLGADTIAFFDVGGTVDATGTARVGTGSALVDIAVVDDEVLLVAGTSVSQAQAQTVALLYEAALDRDGEIDLDGLNFWIDAREGILPNGAPPFSEEELAAAFLAVPEFIDAFGDPADLTNEEFVDILYFNILDRVSEPAGRDFWIAALDNPAVDQADVLLAFAKSPENRAGSAFVEDLMEVSDGTWAFA